jgi:hypothetical protein
MICKITTRLEMTVLFSSCGYEPSVLSDLPLQKYTECSPEFFQVSLYAKQKVALEHFF